MLHSSNKIMCLAILLILSIASCSSSTQNRPSVVFPEGRIGWYDFLQVSSLHSKAFPQKTGEGVYMFTVVAGSTSTIQLSDGTPIRIEPGKRVALLCAQQLRSEQYKTLWDECLENGDRAKARSESGNKLSFSRFIALAEKAVSENGKCTWLGYDQSLDRRMRALGNLARQDDTRLFFVKLKC